MARRRDIVGLVRDRDRAFRVRAESLEDLEIVSSMLQDAIVPISEITYQRSDKRFVLMTQRFRWESAEQRSDAVPDPETDGATDSETDRATDEPRGGEAPNDDASDASEASETPESSDTAGPSYERVLCALRIENVTAVRTHGIDLAKRDQMLELLSLHLADGSLDLAFADGKTIRLSTPRLSCHAEDIGEAWPTAWRPEHPDDQ
ncbi:MAG: DUF2948 family protein [Proteobacteria bacterium]|nr:DUF2948 family protein [Pseudomonadota bacterium]MDA1308193.1 DUF2948 family protein [Pseudomonadota bacterium]